MEALRASLARRSRPPRRPPPRRLPPRRRQPKPRNARAPSAPPGAGRRRSRARARPREEVTPERMETYTPARHPVDARPLAGVITGARSPPGFVTPSRGKRREYRFSFQDVVLLRTAHSLQAAQIAAAQDPALAASA